MNSADDNVTTAVPPRVSKATLDRSKTVVQAMRINDVESMEEGDYIEQRKN
jgi:hypothetical protein